LHADVTNGLLREIIICRQKREPARVIDPREKDRLFEETITRNNGWIGFLARNNAPINSWQDLEQEIRIAFWESMDSYDVERSSLETWFFSAAKNTVKKFIDKNNKTKKRDEAVYPNPVFVEQDRDELRIIEEFTRTLGKLDRQVFTMYIDDLTYAEMSVALSVDEANLRKRMSRIKEQFKEIYRGF
jgi:RNA polymerase sigma factor (sigma-70 family)